MDTFALVAQRIIKEQQMIIGPVAVDQARSVVGIELSASGEVTSIAGDGKAILDRLVRQYEKLFGRASIEACREAVKEISSQIATKDLPTILQ